MTYRVYARWPGQKVSHKTVTESLDVADLAYDRLINTDWGNEEPLGIAFTEDGKQLDYFSFEKSDME